ncbi:MAG: MATE family efflux transporter [Termitinemataceae bacterium]|nr:MAG: MATE family efflux transporter [Termitinemataceae bacterium]
MKKIDPAGRLGTEPIGKLLLQFSIPCIAGMLLNALYNVVDRIFVGRGVGEIALGGISLVMPLMTLSMGFAMLFGIGAANMISMRLGQGKKDEAENALNHCFVLLIGIGIVLMSIGFLFLEPILGTLGARSDGLALDYARRYLKIIMLGMPFFMVSFGLSHTSRAQGFPMVSLMGMVLGAVLNTILDPIFIFGFRWGVEGAALATIISQFVSAVFMFTFGSSKKAVIRLQKTAFKPSLAIFSAIMVFGSAPSILQFAISAVQLVMNKSIGWYGASSLGVANGDEIALSAFNICGSIIMLTLMPVFGINQGAQPILGFNYGAKQFKRVRRSFLLAVMGATVICTLGTIIVQIFPSQIVRFFVPNGSPEILQFTPAIMRITFLIIPLTGFQIVSTNMFVVTGRPRISIFLALLRQVIILIPCIVIFGRVWGLYGIVAAQPVSDALALIVTSVFIFKEMKTLKTQV